MVCDESGDRRTAVLVTVASIMLARVGMTEDTIESLALASPSQAGEIQRNGAVHICSGKTEYRTFGSAIEIGVTRIYPGWWGIMCAAQCLETKDAVMTMFTEAVSGPNHSVTIR